MKWVATSEEMPEVGRRVLCAMYADPEYGYVADFTKDFECAMYADPEYGFPVCGFFDGEYWIIDDVQQLVDKKKVQYWCPIARIPRRGR